MSERDTPRVDALMKKWDDDGATRGSAFVELRDLARELEVYIATAKPALQFPDDSRLERAERALRNAGFTDEGGADWKPPLGRMPVARMQAEVSDRPFSKGEMFFELVILNRARCRDDMMLYDGAFRHGDPRVARWDFMMRVMDNPGGPEDKMGDLVEDEFESCGRFTSEPRSVQIATVIDTAIARLAAQGDAPC